MHAPLLFALALAALPSSKLGAHVVNPAQGGANTVLAACPRLAVFAAPGANGGIASFHAACPLSNIAVSGAPGGLRFTAAMDPRQCADQAWNAFVGNLAGVDSSYVRWVEVVAEPGAAIPDWRTSSAAATWAAAFFAQLADRIHAAGYVPLVGSVPAGAGAGEFAAIAEEMQKKTYGWAWSYQAFSGELSTAASDPALGYRSVRGAAGLAGIPIILSRGGRAAPGWRTAGTSRDAYLAWMKGIDARLQEDSEVVGLALFEFGDTASPFSLADLAGDLASHLASASFSDAGVPGPRCDGGCGAASPDVGRPSSGTTPTGSSVAIEEGSGCSSAGPAAIPALALLLLGLLRRR